MTVLHTAKPQSAGKVALSKPNKGKPRIEGALKAVKIAPSKHGMTFKRLVSSPIGLPEAIHIIRSALSPAVVNQAVDFLDVPQSQLLGYLKIPVSSFHRKLSEERSLSPEETERVLRLAEVTRLATEAFGDPASASLWLQARSVALTGQSPLEMLDTDIGTQQVRRVLSTINYGGVL
jgi:putative toxin-antitoxin system antitoxin component (TIGR02293 family)